VLTGIAAREVRVEYDNGRISLVIAPTAPNRVDGGSVKFNADAIGRVTLTDQTWSTETLRARAVAAQATPGNDTVLGFSGDDTLSGGAGNDTLQGFSGNDSYVWNRGDGHDVIDEENYDSGDRLVLNGVTASQISFQRSGESVTLVISASTPGGTNGGSIRLTTLRPNSDSGIESVVLGAVTWSASELAARVLALSATSGNDRIVGFSGDSTFNGLAGNDTLIGGSGADTYIWERGGGHDTIDERNGWGDESDTLILRGVASSQVSLQREGADVLIVIRPSAPQRTDGGSVRLLAPEPAFSMGVETIVFSDTTWTSAAMLALVVAGAATSGNDTIHGFSGDDRLQGGTGNDTLVGGSGNDTYVWNRGDGDDVIDDRGSYETSRDTLRLEGVAAANVSLTRSGLDITLVISPSVAGGRDGGTVRLVGIDPDNRDGVETIILRDTSWSIESLIARVITQQATAGNDQIVGFSGDDTLRGGRGDDNLSGGEGDDRYIWSRGDGNDVIDEPNWSGGGDTLVLEGVSSSQVRFERAGQDLLVIIAASSTGAGASIRLLDIMNGGSSTGIESVVLSDLRLSLDQVLAGLATTPGDDRIVGTDGDDVLTGGTGNDTLLGGHGNDRYNWSRGDGHDIINEVDPFRSNDRLQLFGVTASKVTLDRSGPDVTLVIAPSAAGRNDGGSVKLIDLRVENIVLDDATWTAADLRARLLNMVSTSGDDTITGFGDDEILAGGWGNDTLRGNGGGDTYIWRHGDGHDVINGDYDDKLILERVSATRVSLERSGQDVTIVISPTLATASDGGSIKLIEPEAWGGRVGTIMFADAVWTIGELLAKLTDATTTPGSDAIVGFEKSSDTLRGGAGDDVIDGLSGDDTIIGGPGRDVLRGGEQIDTYLWSRGDGDDSIIDVEYSWNRVSLTDVLSRDVRLVRTGNDVTLVIVPSVPGGSDGGSVKLVDFFAMFLRFGYIQFQDVLWRGDDLWDRVIVQQTTDGDDMVVGTPRSETLEGGAGNDTLDGADNLDTLIGGPGNDVYIVDYPWNYIIERENEGIDTVRSSVNRLLAADVRTYILAGNVENLVLTGTASLNGRGNALNNVLTGNSGRNYLEGGAGDDILDGLENSDTLVGGQGNDTYIVESSGDRVVEGAHGGTDTVRASVSHVLTVHVENLVLTGSASINATGNASINSLVGNAGNNLLDGKSGGDTMAGGAGDDSYVVDTAADVVIEAAGAGADIIRSSASYTLSANVEALVLIGSAAINATGNALDNSLTGNAGSNVLDGGGGADRMSGGGGNDVYFVDNAGDVVLESLNAGTDTVHSSITYSLSGNVEKLVLTGTAAIDGQGNSLNNALTGNRANNILKGAIGSDRMVGGAGDDTYIVDNTRDLIIENADEGLDVVNASASYTLTDHVERLILTGRASINGAGNSLDNIITGNDGNNILDGRGGRDTLTGGVGNDVYHLDQSGDIVIENANGGTDTIHAAFSYVLGAHVENLVLTGTATTGTGNAVNNTLTGNGANNLLDGGIGADRMAAGLGNDLYIVDNLRDVVIENAGAGVDTVNASVTHVLSANVERLVLTGLSSINGTGNALDNRLTGNAGNNVLDGGAGSDTMVGGTGDDTYVVDVVGDVVTESAGAGADTVRSSISYVLAAHVESLILTGAAAINATGNTLNNNLTGNAAGNSLDGGAGADRMSGGGGDDFYFVDSAGDVVVEALNGGIDTVNSSVSQILAANVEHLVLSGVAAIDGRGNSLNNTMTGNRANNVLEGGVGNDWLTGLAGNDTFVFGRGFGTDRITDFAAGPGQGDRLQLSLGSTFDSFAEVRAVASQVNADTVINFGGLGNLTLQNVSVATLVADDFLFAA
jgi:Ca2+-binding RTX toxin-like protein